MSCKDTLTTQGCATKDAYGNGKFCVRQYLSVVDLSVTQILCVLHTRQQQAEAGDPRRGLNG